MDVYQSFQWVGEPSKFRYFYWDGMNDPLYLEDAFVNLARVLSVFDEEKIQE